MSNQSKYSDPTDDPAYQTFVESMVIFCRCEPFSERPCDGVLAGGPCDEMKVREELENTEPDEEY